MDYNTSPLDCPTSITYEVQLFPSCPYARHARILHLTSIPFILQHTISALSNIQTQCLQFVDPYVEHDNLTLLLDLILLKRGVYRHLLFNRGYGGRHAIDPEDSDKGRQEQELSAIEKTSIDKAREKARWNVIVRLGTGLIFVDAFIRWSHLQPAKSSRPNIDWTQDSFNSFLRIFAGCAIETIAFHAGVTFTCALVLRLLKIFHSIKRPSSPSMPSSGIRNEFRLSHVSLTLFYSSLTKLFLLLLLTVWKPSSSTAASATPLAPQTHESNNDVHNSTPLLDKWIVDAALELLNEDKLDREWVVRNLLGGMAAGFGLRVVLDMPPAFTTIIVLSGWAVKTAVANLVHPWVGQSENISDVFLQYSIP